MTTADMLRMHNIVRREFESGLTVKQIAQAHNIHEEVTRVLLLAPRFFEWADRMAERDSRPRYFWRQHARIANREPSPKNGKRVKPVSSADRRTATTERLVSRSQRRQRSITQPALGLLSGGKLHAGEVRGITLAGR